jgi:hypothetical protein
VERRERENEEKVWTYMGKEGENMRGCSCGAYVRE